MKMKKKHNKKIKKNLKIIEELAGNLFTFIFIFIIGIIFGLACITVSRLNITVIQGITIYGLIFYMYGLVFFPFFLSLIKSRNSN